MTALGTSLRLSIAELDFIARAADLAAFPGLATDVADPLADGIVLDGLRAHGIVEGWGDELQLREDVAVLLGAIVGCTISLQLETATSQHAIETVLHLPADAAVLQRQYDGLVSLAVVRAEELPAVLLALCGEDPDAGHDGDGACGVRLTPEALAEAELGESHVPELAGYLRSAASPARAGRVCVRGTLYGEPRAACAWLAGPGGTYVVHDRKQDTEVVRADGPALALQLLSLVNREADLNERRSERH